MGLTHVPAVGLDDLEVGVQSVQLGTTPWPVGHTARQLTDGVVPMSLLTYPVCESDALHRLPLYIRVRHDLA